MAGLLVDQGDGYQGTGDRGEHGRRAGDGGGDLSGDDQGGCGSGCAGAADQSPGNAYGEKTGATQKSLRKCADAGEDQENNAEHGHAFQRDGGGQL